jgi:hypothetical protein
LPFAKSARLSSCRCRDARCGEHLKL